MKTGNTLFGTGRVALTVLAIAAGMGFGSVSEVSAQHWSQNAHEWFHLNDPHVDEGEPAVFVVRVPEKLGVAVRWQYRTEDWSATAGSDYVATQGTLQFNIGEREKRITVPTLTDDTIETIPEFFQFELTDLETSADGVTWERAEPIPRVPEYAASAATIRDANLPLDVLNPSDPKEDEVTDSLAESQEDPQPEEVELSPDSGEAGGGPTSEAGGGPTAN